MGEDRSDPPRAGHLPAGYDEADPYEDEDLSTYPDWWRENVELFREYDMRPYRPPRFADGELLPQLVGRLERELDVTIRVRQPSWSSRWTVLIDDRQAGEIDQSRDGDGYSVYQLDSTAFEKLIRAAVERG